MVDVPDKDALRRLREGVEAVRARRDDRPAHAEILALAGAVPSDVAVTVDLEAEADLGHPLVVLRPAAREAPELASLTAREREVAALVAKGLKNREIADVLGIAIGTVKDHVHHIYDKTGFGTRAELASAWRE